MKSVISLCPSGIAIQYIAVKTRRVGSSSKTVTGNTCSKTDCFLQRNFRLTNLPWPGYHLRSKQLLVFRSNCKTWVPNISKTKKLIQAVLPELAHEVTRNQKLTYQDLVSWRLLNQGPTGSSMMIMICIINNVLHNLSRKQSWKQMLPSFSLFSSWHVYLNQILK